MRARYTTRQTMQELKHLRAELRRKRRDRTGCEGAGRGRCGTAVRRGPRDSGSNSSSSCWIARPATCLRTELDDHPRHRLDRLADGRQRRLGAVHQERVVEPDDRNIPGTLRPALRGPDRRRAPWSLAHTIPVTPARSGAAPAWAASIEYHAWATSGRMGSRPSRRWAARRSAARWDVVATGRPGHPIRVWPSDRRWPHRLLDSDRSSPRRAGSRGRRSTRYQDGRELARGEPPVMVVGRIGLRVQSAGKDHAGDLLLEEQVDIVRLGHAAGRLGAQHRRVALLREGAADDIGKRREDRVLEFRQDEPDQPGAFAPKLRRSLVAQDVEGRQDPLAGSLRDTGLLVEDAAHRRLGDANLLRHIRESSCHADILRNITQECCKFLLGARVSPGRAPATRP